MSPVPPRLLPLLLLSLLAVGCATVSRAPQGKDLAARRQERRAEVARSLAEQRRAAHYEGALAAWERGALAECEAELRSLLEAEPEFTQARRALADLLVSTSRYEEAERELRALLQREPEEPEHLHALGLLLEETGRHAEAAELLQQAARQMPRNPLLSLTAQAVAAPAAPAPSPAPVPERGAPLVLPASHHAW